ncbi:MAG: SH3 domain-containing protein [Anaerolineaceae bacterium]|nr:SH3 domain-containing protein [Anaerolineaceae bacterium]
MMKRAGMILVAVMLLSSLLVIPAAAQSGVWTAEYFNNAGLSGSPTYILSENSPSHDWGAGSPAASIPVDYFSARWTSVQTLAAGNYTLNVQADDGVRVFIDGIAYINEWHLAPGTSYTANLTLGAGQHTIVVEFYENTGLAYLSYTLAQVGSSTSATATVTASQLNVRNAPNPYTGLILFRITKGQVYPVVGRNADSSWLQLSANGTTGWVNSNYVIATNLQNVPVTDNSTRPTGATATVTAYFLNVRQTPDPYNGVILVRIARGESYAVVGKNADGSWLQLNINGTIGWVNSGYVVAVNLENVPVTDSSTRPTGSTATVTAYFLNVRNIPAYPAGSVLTRIARGQSYSVVGRNAASTWVQINVNGIVGWVNASYVYVTNLGNVPVTG